MFLVTQCKSTMICVLTIVFASQYQQRIIANSKQLLFLQWYVYSQLYLHLRTNRRTITNAFSNSKHSFTMTCQATFTYNRIYILYQQGIIANLFSSSTHLFSQWYVDRCGVVWNLCPFQMDICQIGIVKTIR